VLMPSDHRLTAELQFIRVAAREIFMVPNKATVLVWSRTACGVSGTSS
jgi:hypothetical protein